MNMYSWMSGETGVENLGLTSLDLDKLLKLRFGFTSDQTGYVNEWGGVSSGALFTGGIAFEINKEIERRLASGALTQEELLKAESELPQNLRREGSQMFGNIFTKLRLK